MAIYDQKYGIGFLKEMKKRVEEAIYTPLCTLTAQRYLTREPVPFAQRQSGEYRKIEVGQRWGGELFDCAWFHFTGTLPENIGGKPVALLLDVSGEMLMVDGEGRAVRGLTTHSSTFDLSLGMPGKVEYPFLESARGGEAVDVWADCAFNDLFGDLHDDGILARASAAVVHPQVKALYYDAEVLLELAEHLPEDSARRAGILSALTRALRLPEITDEAAKAARAVLAPELARKGADIGFEISAVGHAHMDLAWLWPIRETIRKCGRTFATVLRNMETYPEYVFGASQPQQYQWVKDHYPELYAQVKQRVAEGRWELQGGMWVEADINMAGAEALVRQVLYGKRFFMEEFGVDVKTLWLPDVFSYSPAIPQIMKKSGMDYFVNMRSVVLNYSKFPYNSFWWKGIDGSRVITHVMPEGTYNSSAAPRAVLKSERDFLNKGESGHALLLYGIGDGGGGPGEEHLERLAREKDLSGLAPVVQRPAQAFFERLSQEGDTLPTWSGEIFVDMFQGTYTSQARVKYHMRKLERMLRSLEILWGAALISGRGYPAEAIERLWKETLLYQFHDILPGSSITRVNAEMVERALEMEKEIEGLMEKALPGGRDVLLNPHGFAVTHVFEREGRPARICLSPTSATPVSQAEETRIDVSFGDDFLENEHLRAEFDGEGRLVKLYDKQDGSQYITAPANTLSVYHDPGDAWRVPPEAYENPAGRFVPVSSASQIEGVSAVRTTRYAFGSSTLTQRAVLRAGEKALCFETHAHWDEVHKVLRSEFPVDVSGGRFTTEIQFGAIERPNHINLGSERGKYEVYAHRFADLSRHDRGVALLNNSKYGHGCDGATLSITLLRAPTFPDPVADRAEHEFTYAIYPHRGDVRTGGVARQAALVNDPVTALKGGAMESLVSVPSEEVELTAVKKAEDGDALILRLYEMHGGRARAEVKLGFDCARAALVDLMERETAPLEVCEGGAIALEFAPREILSVKVYPKG